MMYSKTILLLQIAVLIVFVDQNTPITENSSFVKLSISGNQINNTYNISGDKNNAEQNATAMILPDGNSGKYKIAELNYMDAAQKISVYIKIPAKAGLIELKENNEDFGLFITKGDIDLKAQSISVNLEEVVIDKIMGMTASFAKGSFEGIAIYEHTTDGKEIKEPYMVSGNFQFQSPRHKPNK